MNRRKFLGLMGGAAFAVGTLVTTYRLPKPKSRAPIASDFYIEPIENTIHFNPKKEGGFTVQELYRHLKEEWGRETFTDISHWGSLYEPLKEIK
jgi:hypothetical protein